MPYKIKARTRKPVYRKPAQRKKVTTVKAVKKIVNKVINKKIETKKLDLNLGLININHNNFSAVPGNKVQVILNNPGVNMPIQGDAQFNCDGLKYNIIGCHLYFMFQIAADRMNTKFRVLVVRASASKTFSAYDDLFDNITGNITLDPPDREKVVVLYDKLVSAGRSINPTNSTDNLTIFRKIFLKKQKYTVKHESTNSTSVLYPRYRDHLFVFAYDASSSLSTDTLGSVQIHRRLVFTDM